MENTGEKNWYNCKELSAGTNRLLLTYYIYKIFGPLPVKIIAFFVSFFTYLKADEQRKYSKEFFMALENFTGKSSKKFGTLKRFINFGSCLADKMIAYSGGIKAKKFYFQNENGKNEIIDLIKNQKGIFFITTHIGNIEIMRSFLNSKDIIKPKKVNIFMEQKTCEIFNGFLNKINKISDIETLSIEDFGAQTPILIDEKLNDGEIIFMAGDRISKNAPTKAELVPFLGRKIKLPIGTFKLAQIIGAPVFFIACVKCRHKFKIYTQKFEFSGDKKEDFKKILLSYGNFLENLALLHPTQFFHFFKVLF